MPTSDDQTQIALGIDIGGTRVKAGMVTAAGQALASIEGHLPSDGNPAPLVTLVKEQANMLRLAAGRRPKVVGVALPGVWDRRTGIMRRAVNLPKLEGVHLPRLFEEALGGPVYLETDVNAAAWGQWGRLDPRPRRLVYLSLGTGVGGSVIVDGRILRHTRGGAGHFGFLIVDTSPEAPTGRNGVRGCLAAIASGPALHRAATGAANARASGDEPLPEQVIERAARGLAVGLAQLTHLYAPDVLLLGGGVIDHHPELLDRARAAFTERAGPLVPDGLRIERAPLATHEAGVIGVALLALAGERD